MSMTLALGFYSCIQTTITTIIIIIIRPQPRHDLSASLWKQTTQSLSAALPFQTSLLLVFERRTVLEYNEVAASAPLPLAWQVSQHDPIVSYCDKVVFSPTGGMIWRSSGSGCALFSALEHRLRVRSSRVKSLLRAPPQLFHQIVLNFVGSPYVILIEPDRTAFFRTATAQQ